MSMSMAESGRNALTILRLIQIYLRIVIVLQPNLDFQLCFERDYPTVASGSDIKPCIKIDKPLVACRFW